MAGLRLGVLSSRRVLLSNVLFVLPLLLGALFVGGMLVSTASMLPTEITTYRRATIRMGPRVATAAPIRPSATIAPR